MSDTCFLCGCECKIYKFETGCTLRYTCPSCGTFRTPDGFATLCSDNQELKFKAACGAAERHLWNQEEFMFVLRESDVVESPYPTITIERLAESFPKSATELLDRSLLNIGRMIKHPGDRIELTENSRLAFFSPKYEQMKYVIHQFVILEYISSPVESRTTKELTLYIQSKGWEKIDELTKTTGADSKQAFVAMWFDDSRKDIYDNGIFKAIDEDCKLKPIRIDLVEHNDDIVDEIIAEIKRSRFVVADFTGGRQGVYFEAGFARGLGIPVIWLVQKDHLDDLHFDTRQFNHIVYEGPEDLRKKLANRIKATVL